MPPKVTNEDLREHTKALGFAPVDTSDFKLPVDPNRPNVIIRDSLEAIRFAVNAVRVPQAVTGPRLVFYPDGSRFRRGSFGGAGIAARYFYPGAPKGWKEFVYGLQVHSSGVAEFVAIHRALGLALEMTSLQATNPQKTNHG
ncbi:hypothetical protein HD806DRAFT_526072 [Xylariaceae sp. AK1471]|nr:hypothetical protein HD806DRAFT_526072 [Xylariaceae sp. AK1471]